MDFLDDEEIQSQLDILSEEAAKILLRNKFLEKEENKLRQRLNNLELNKILESAGVGDQVRKSIDDQLTLCMDESKKGLEQFKKNALEYSSLLQESLERLQKRLSDLDDE